MLVREGNVIIILNYMKNIFYILKKKRTSKWGWYLIIRQNQRALYVHVITII